MRPKKTILLLDGDERRASLRRFILETRRYEVHVRTSANHAATALHPTINLYGPDLVMVSDTVPVPNAVIRLAKDVNPETRAIVLQDGTKPVETPLADAVTVWDMGHAADLLCIISTLMVRKRGPKKRTPVPTAVPTEARSAA